MPKNGINNTEKNLAIKTMEKSESRETDIRNTQERRKAIKEKE